MSERDGGVVRRHPFHPLNLFVVKRPAAGGIQDPHNEVKDCLWPSFHMVVCCACISGNFSVISSLFLYLPYRCKKQILFVFHFALRQSYLAAVTPPADNCDHSLIRSLTSKNSSGRKNGVRRLALVPFHLTVPMIAFAA